jgi:hypothetical protein
MAEGMIRRVMTGPRAQPVGQRDACLSIRVAYRQTAARSMVIWRYV